MQLTILNLHTRRRDAQHLYRERWREVKEAQRGRCLFCGERVPLTVDHVVPLSVGGNNRRSNLRGLCIDCHQALHGLDHGARLGTGLGTRLIMVVELIRGGRESVAAKVICWLLYALVVCRGKPLLDWLDGETYREWPTAEGGFKRAIRGLALPRGARRRAAKQMALWH